MNYYYLFSAKYLSIIVVLALFGNSWRLCFPSLIVVVTENQPSVTNVSIKFNFKNPLFDISLTIDNEIVVFSPVNECQ